MVTAIKNVRVFNGDTLTAPTTVCFEDGYIVENKPADIEIDGTGKTLLPGFIDTHIHIDAEENCQLAARSGITTLIDQMCNNTALIDSLREPGPNMASVLSCYMPVQSEAGPMMKQALGYDTDFVATKENVHKTIDREIGKGALYIKIIFDNPPLTTGMLSEELAAETVSYAHQCGKITSAHCTSVMAYERGAHCGVDILNHFPKDEPLPQQIIDEIKAKNLTVIPTMVMQEGMVENLKKMMPERAGSMDIVLDACRRVHEAGIKILVGTDSNNTNALCHVKHGESIFREFDLLSQAGLSPVEILQGCTTEAARIFGLADRGTIVPGKRADLVLVEGDPIKDITACRNIRKVWVKGNAVNGAEV